MRLLIMTQGMAPSRAAVVLNQLDDAKPWYSRLDYLRALAAIAAAFPDEMARKTYAQGRTVGNVLWCAAAPDRVAWQWNVIIVGGHCPRPGSLCYQPAPLRMSPCIPRSTGGIGMQARCSPRPCNSIWVWHSWGSSSPTMLPCTHRLSGRCARHKCWQLRYTLSSGPAMHGSPGAKRHRA